MQSISLQIIDKPVDSLEDKVSILALSFGLLEMGSITLPDAFEFKSFRVSFEQKTPTQIRKRKLIM
jgi:hypothetical protein